MRYMGVGGQPRGVSGERVMAEKEWVDDDRASNAEAFLGA